jgi:fatty-acid desaturase
MGTLVDIQLESLEKRQAAKDEINWVTLIFMALFHIGAIAALFFFTWKALFVAAFLWWISGSLGIGMSYHRLLTIRTRTATPILPLRANGGRTWAGF